MKGPALIRAGGKVNRAATPASRSRLKSTSVVAGRVPVALI
jgi:hypothetical protein